MIVWAFNELSRERDPSTIEGKRVNIPRISYRAIREWADFRGYSDDADLMDELYTLVRAMDTVWIEVESKLIREQQGKPNGKPA